MKRMTIFPSSRAARAAFLALGVGGVLAVPGVGAAQQPPAQPAPAPAAAQPASPPPPTHIVQKGETLWALAQQFFGDPLFWPEIYRLNTSVIEDPHWIFPGEELHLTETAAQMAAAPAGASAAAAAPTAPAAEPAESAAAPGAITVTPAAAVDTSEPAPPAGPEPNPAVGPTIFAGQSTVSPEAAAAVRLRESHAYRAVRRGEFLSAGFVLEAGEALNAGRLLGNAATASIKKLTTSSDALLYGSVAVVPPTDTVLKAGDVLESYVEPRVITGYGPVVMPTGLLRVTAVDSAQGIVTAQVVTMYGTVSSGQSVMLAPVYHEQPGVRPVAVSADSAITGEVIDLRVPHQLVTEQDVVFLNRGSEDGVRLGDVFDVSGTVNSAVGAGEIVQDEAHVLVVFTRPHMSSAVVIEVRRPDIRPGSAARQIYRMPS